MEFLFTGRAAFRKLERIVEELTRTADDFQDVIVVLLPQNLTIKEIRYAEADTVFLCDGHASDKSTSVCIPNGQPFSAVIEIIPKRGRTRLITGFTDQLYSPSGRL